MFHKIRSRRQTFRLKMMNKLSLSFSFVLLTFFAAQCESTASQKQLLRSCCNEHVPGNWTQCLSTCLQFGSSCPPNVENKTEYLSSYCPTVPSTLQDCFDNVTTSNTPATPTPSPQLLECCNRSENQGCRQVCREQVTIGIFDDASIQIVIAACGSPYDLQGGPTDPMWDCFILYNEGQTEPNSGGNSSCPNTPTPATGPTVAPTALPPTFNYADWPRLQCCSMANDSSCLDACHYEYTGSRTTQSWEKLNLDCVFRATEGRLVSCLQDVSTRCRSGCSGLQFCSNFNNKPLTSFRKCDAEADTNAKAEYDNWVSQGVIRHPLVTINTRPLTTCFPERWKVLACAFQMMPCQPKTDTSLICKSDCLHLMRECKSNLLQSEEEICEILSPSYLQEGCIRIDDFLNDSYYKEDASFLTTPCSSSPCTTGKCIVNQACSTNEASCLPYHCVEEAQVGHSPKMSLEKVNLVQASLLPGNREESCHGYVNCTLDSNGECVFGGKLSNVSGRYCIEEASCSYKGKNYSHHDIFSDDCNICQCISSYINCTHHDCPVPQGSASIASKTCSPPYCSCPSLYQPICSSNGLTLPNLFHLNCHGYTDGGAIGQSCYQNNPCSSSASLCPSGSKCIPARHTCMSANGSALQDCPQYYCVSSNNCDQYQGSVICDQSGSEHESMCDFTNTNEKVDYYGHCKIQCSINRRRPVCSVNGDTYPSVCHARGMGVAIDYYSECNDVPRIETGKCEKVKCPDMPFMNTTEQCTGPTPPGACCQQCGSLINILVNKVQLSRSSQAMNVDSIDSTRIINRLKAFVDILQCQLYGHQAVDGSIVVLLLPSNMTSWLNIEACNAVSTRLSTLINRRSPLIAMDPYLSFLTAARSSPAGKVERPLSTQEPSTGSAGISGSSSLAPVSGLFLLSIIIVNLFWAGLSLDLR
ncbi:PREDICTED: reversion-inducing cysteine-rich protein with Kazal motifs-like isoform X1 [Amphimedon queenslandica]|uniref:Kazal-like domain-containing protein n=1 Tax=Amphimedon queenslandica TaxID=400682 RepID=A0A1X7VP70_AMPQE|nr:PREDICTED: reversion-inducing cysteine-rich protein with Kazal motifs-like isoform X1 [Amphimedon queenslandica]|eukprot:XP_019857591.1 PREDICTED: reversion-inducing cysteine-rich protein with Kazal motifs-like isoform X1 [Amphimedon queenslandica]